MNSNKRLSRLSSQQNDLLILEKYGNVHNSYNLNYKIKFIDIEYKNVFICAVQDIINSIKILNTRVVGEDEFPLLLYEDSKIDIEYFDAYELKYKSYNHIISKMQKTNFFQFNDILSEFLLVRESSQNFLFYISLHHIIFDAKSASILRKKIYSRYQDLINNINPIVNEDYRYLEYVKKSWHKDITTELLYWEELLRNKTYEKSFIPEKSRPLNFSYEGNIFEFTISNNVSRKVDEFATANNCSPFFVLLLSYAILLMIETKSLKVILATPFDLREQYNMGDSIGFFIRNLILPISADNEDNITSIIKKIKILFSQSIKNSDISFLKILEHLDATRKSNFNPIYNSTFNYIDDSNNSMAFIEELNLTKSQFDFSMDSIKKNNSYEFKITYSTQLFDSIFIKRLIDLYNKVLIKTVSLNPNEVKVSDLVSHFERVHESNHFQELESKKTQRNNEQFDIKNRFKPIPRTRKEFEISQIWSKLLSVDIININEDFFDIGGYSLLMMQMIAEINKRYDVRVPVADILKNPTIENIANIVENQSKVLEYMNNIENLGGTGESIYLIHPIGGTIWSYLDLILELKKNYKVLGINMIPGDYQYRSIKELAQIYGEAILKEHNIKEPLRIAGYSFGGNIAYEVYLYLIEHDCIIKYIYLFDCFFPVHQSNLKQPHEYIIFFLERFKKKKSLVNYLKSDEEVIEYDKEELMNYILTLMRISKYMPENTTVYDVQEILYPWINNYRALNEYSIFDMQPISVPVLFFRATDSEEDSLVGWNQILNDCKVINVEANHYTLLRKPNTKKIAKIIYDYS